MWPRGLQWGGPSYFLPLYHNNPNQTEPLVFRLNYTLVTLLCGRQKYKHLAKHSKLQNHSSCCSRCLQDLIYHHDTHTHTHTHTLTHTHTHTNNNLVLFRKHCGFQINMLLMSLPLQIMYITSVTCVTFISTVHPRPPPCTGFSLCVVL